MSTLAYQVVDVFTDTAFAGNPLAVVLDTDGMTTEQLQALAREFNLSETAFPQVSEKADYRLRIFTPATELPFAGHPSVGAAWVMARLGRVDRGPVTMECGAGLLPLEVGDDDVTLTGGEPTDSGPLDPVPLLAAVGLDASALAGGAPRACGAGIDFAHLFVGPGELERARPDLHLLEGLGLSGVNVFTIDATSPDEGLRVRSRVFAGGVGVAEDPATGSAQLGLGVWLKAEGFLREDPRYVVVQGVEMGRRSVLRCRDLGDRFSVTGQVVPVARGEVLRP
ncbi:MAG: phenazine biosynthesis protein phzf family [Frankiales bacterium]|nr:phenazine biosynthesis protein phzf family [Frankiales bacterium]